MRCDLLAGVVIAVTIAFVGGRPGMISAATGAMALVMIDWGSLETLHKVPAGETSVMVRTVATVVLTHDLAKGVIAGVILSALMFARKIVRAAVRASAAPTRATSTGAAATSAPVAGSSTGSRARASKAATGSVGSPAGGRGGGSATALGWSAAASRTRATPRRAPRGRAPSRCRS